MDNDAELTAADAAKILGVTATHVNWYFRQGLLPGRRIGARVLVFRREDVERFEKPKKTGRPKAGGTATARRPQKAAKPAPDAATKSVPKTAGGRTKGTPKPK